MSSLQLPLSLLELTALGYFFFVWAGYAQYAKWRAKRPQSNKPTLSTTLRKHRVAWVEHFLRREQRISDASLLANQERVVGFFASTTLILLAAAFTALSNSEEITQIASHLPFTVKQTIPQVEAKLMVLLLILTYAFFKISWSLRQYGFVSVLMGSAPPAEVVLTANQRQDVVHNIAKLMDSAGHHNNSGLRAYYFGIALLSWLLSILWFVIVTTLVVYVLYQREFNSSAVISIERAYLDLDTDSE